jgi:hypothetical protein
MNAAVHVEINEISNALSHAAAVTLTLAGQGCNVIAAMANGRRPILMVDRIPPGLETVTKRSHPNGMGGTTVVTAAHFHGCQLEWMHDLPGSKQPPELRVVVNG